MHSVETKMGVPMTTREVEKRKWANRRGERLDFIESGHSVETELWKSYKVNRDGGPAFQGLSYTGKEEALRKP